MSKKLLSIVTPTFNEEDNVLEIARQVRAIMAELPDLDYEHLFIDNASTDHTVDLLRKMAAEDTHIKVIVNSRNFGWIRSPYHALCQAEGDAVVLIAADLQEPPALISTFVEKWREGFDIVMAIRAEAKESALFFAARRFYYMLVDKLADIDLIRKFNGFALYDRRVITEMKKFENSYPYLRGLVSEVGFRQARVDYVQPTRMRGFSKSNFFALYDVAMLGITSHSKLPLRMATMTGLALSILSLLMGFVYLVLKLLYWNYFPMGMAPVLLGVFFFAAVQLFFIGLMGEYILSIHTMVRKGPLVIEQERINF
jgi:glycosyltransferase involved in cell wall biosynthesis